MNRILNSGSLKDMQTLPGGGVFTEGMGESAYIEHLENLVKERRRRRKAQGGSGAAYGYSTEGTEGYVDPVMVPKSKPDFDILNTNKTLDEIQKNIYYEHMYSDADITKAIQDLNKSVSTGDVGDIGEWYEDALAMFNAERKERAAKRSRGESGGSGDIIEGEGGSAGAQKAQGWEAQMMAESGKVQADLPDMPGGAIGKLAYNIENFHAGADIGNVPQILETARFVPKRNMWHFPVDPDVGVFDLNGFFNRMAHPGHKFSTDEITVLARVLEQAKSYPSRRNLSSMAEDLYKTMVSGPAKSGLEGIGFNIQ